MEHGYLYQLLRKAGLSDFGASTLEFVLVRPLKIAAILVAAVVLGRLAARTIRRLVRGVHARTPLRTTSVRAEQRAGTVSDAFAGMARIAILAVGGLIALDEVGVNLAPLLAGAGIAGLAVGFGAQTLVRDVIAGLFILLEDQYGVGDIVSLGADTTGTVEDVNLRTTRLRATDGTVWFVPNGEVRKVGNQSMEWSRAVVDFPIPYDADLELVRRVMTEEADAIAADPRWEGEVLEPPEVLGVQSLANEGPTMRLVVKTAPRQQFAIARELRGRITSRLRAEGVRWAVKSA